MCVRMASAGVPAVLFVPLLTLFLPMTRIAHAMVFPSWTYALITCVSLSSVKSAGAQQAPEMHPRTFPRVTIPNTEVRALKSSATGRGYDLYVHLPAEYARNKDKKYPVLYV